MSPSSSKDSPATSFSPLPSHLAGTAARGGVVGERIAQFEIGSMRNFIYLIIDWQVKQAAIVDPQKDLSAPLGFLAEHGISLTRVLLTHTHHDHVAGVPALISSHPDAPITVHPGDLPRLKAEHRARARIDAVEEGTILHVGGIAVTVLHTPGHSAGECCYLVEGSPSYLLTGDTLFIRDCGRTDLETGDVSQMFESLQRILKLSPTTVILPGHHYAPEIASTLDRERVESAPLRCRSVAELESCP